MSPLPPPLPDRDAGSTRRGFLKTTVLGGAALPLAARTASSAARSIPSGGRKGRLLVLGGTVFLGPAVVEEALARGWEVTLFNRGRSNPGMFPDLEKRVGDRDGQLEALEEGEWDAVIDTSGYVPRLVKLSAELLADRVGHYVFVSTVSVYKDEGEALHEESPVGVLEDPTVERVTGETYGPLKALCEQAAEAAMPGRVANVRPGLIVGPLDSSGRFTYWPVRVARGGEVLAPGDPGTQQEFIDVRDLASFLMHCCEEKITGVYNANGPGLFLSMEEFLHGCKVVTGADASFTWIPDEELLELDVGPWMELPLWVPASMPNSENIVTKAHAAGLRSRPAGDTIRDTLAWAKTAMDNPRTMGRSLTAEKEAAVLAKWHAREE